MHSVIFLGKYLPETKDKEENRALNSKNEKSVIIYIDTYISRRSLVRKILIMHFDGMIK